MIKTIKFENLSADTRKEYGVATIPFAQGEWLGNSADITTTLPDTRPMYVRAFGAKYPDGSYRYGQAYIPLLINGYATAAIELAVGSPTAGTPQPPPFAAQFALPPVVAAPGLTPTNMKHEVYEANAARFVIKQTYRLGSFVVEMYVYVYSQQSLVPFELRITASNPSVTDLVYPVSEFNFSATSLAVSIYGASRRGAARTGMNSYRLCAADSWAEGQSQCWYGNIYLNAGEPDANVFAAEINQLYGMCTGWRESGAFGAFGSFPAALTTDESAKHAYVASKFEQHYQYKSGAGSLWEDMPLGVTKSPGATGDQRDFGLFAGWDVLDSARAPLLESYRFNALEDAMRPGHYKEVDGSPVRSALHPNWVTWSGVTHWHPVVSSDKLGKLTVINPSITHDWLGKDNEHWSSNLLGTAALLCNSYQLEDELNVEAELFLSGHTLPSMKPGWSTNSIGASRAVGRVYMAMAYNYLVTAREDIKQRVLARTSEVVYPQWVGRTQSPVRPLTKIGPDARQLPLYESWLPWQECLAVPGLEAWHRLTGNAQLREIAVAIANNTVKYGWRITTNPAGQITSFDCGNAVRFYADGSPITDEQYFEPPLIPEAFGPPRQYYNPSIIMHVWTVSTLQIVRDYYQGLVPADVHARATQLLSLITAGQTQVYPRMFEWLI